MNGTITKYVYDNEDIIAEYDGNNQLIASYTHGPGIDEPISMTNGQTYYYHTDALGSIIAITDSNRNVVQRYEYDSFGNIVSVLDPNFTQPYTYTSREYDPETGLYYYRARYYDAKVGRFISEDPIGFKGGDVNFYAYVKNNPLKYTDPTGTFSLCDYCGEICELACHGLHIGLCWIACNSLPPPANVACKLVCDLVVGTANCALICLPTCHKLCKKEEKKKCSG